MPVSVPDALHTAPPTGPSSPPPLTASNATLALDAGLCFLLPLVIFYSFQTAAAVSTLGADVSHIYPFSFLGPPQTSGESIWENA